MKLPKFLVVVISSCVFIEINAEKEFSSRSVTRRYSKRNSLKQKAPVVLEDQEISSKFDKIVLRIEEKLEKFDDKILHIFLRLEDLDEKINGIDDRLFNEKTNDASNSTLPITTRLHLWEEKINDLDQKIDKLINQNDKRLDDSSQQSLDQPLKVKLIEDVLPLDLAIIALQTKESVDRVGEKFLQNLSENSAKLEYLKKYLHAIFEENIYKNNSQPDELLMQIRRKERRIVNDSSLITDILSMVKERLRSEEDDTVKLVEEVSSLTDILTNFENMTSANATKIKAAVRKSGLIFPNIKNKPAKLNTTFVSEGKDGKVS